MKPVKNAWIAQRRTERQRTSVLRVRRRVEAEKASLSGTQTIKAELEQAKSLLNRLAVWGTWRGCLNCKRQNPGTGKATGSRNAARRQTMRLLRNKVTDAEIAEVLARGRGFRFLA